MALMERALIKRRLARHIITARRGPDRSAVTLGDVARWLDCDESLLRHIVCDRASITNEMQVRITQFYTLLDRGGLKIVIDERRKLWVRVKDNPQPEKPIMPRIDFMTMKLLYD